MNIKEHWDRIDPATQRWLIDNPGCQILPRTVTTVICQETGQDNDGGQHGETDLSQEDHDFICSKANEIPSP